MRYKLLTKWFIHNPFPLEMWVFGLNCKLFAHSVQYILAQYSYNCFVENIDVFIDFGIA